MLAVPVGLLASAILVVNNVRDLETDRRAGKRTLAVRLGRERARALFVAMVAGAFVTAPLPWMLGLAVAVAAAELARGAARAAGRAGRADADRRPVAQRRARGDRAAPARVLRAAVRRAAGELGGQRMPMTTCEVHRRVRLRRCAIAAGRRVGRAARARDPAGAARVVRRRLRRVGEAAPLEPYDGVSLGAVAAALDAYGEVLRGADAATPATPSCSRRARTSATCRRRSRRSTSRCGTAPGGAPGGRSRSCSRPGAAERGRR